MTFWDRVDLIENIALYGAVFRFGGSKWRWLATSAILSLHLITIRYFLAFTDSPITALALFHTAAMLSLVETSQSNYGRSLGLCFGAMVAFDGLVLSGALSGDVILGLSLNYWNAISMLQHIQSAILAICFYKHRESAWEAV
jgi:hypothetical protein